ncbi:hypothetical protein DL93DRAFT_2156497 [Clavulina sp. PMI_390]|nr:hypothetical protein DL93DRAFT_2156497 [Clavulina sp. PMI_390]
MDSHAPTIPDQVLIEILEHASYKEVVACRAVQPNLRVCRHWRVAIDTSSSLEYLVWLGIHHKVDGDASFYPRTSAGRLDQLLQHEQAWSTLRHRRSCIIPPVLISTRERICGDDYFEAASESPPQAVFSLSFYRLPSAIANIEGGERLPILSNKNGAYSTYIDAITDPDNELLFLVSSHHDYQKFRLKFHLRWIRDTTRDHPYAQVPILDSGTITARQPGRTALTPNTLRSIVIGHLFIYQMRAQHTSGFFHRRHEGGFVAIFIWDWTTGKRLAKLYLPHTEGSVYNPLSVLSESCFVIPELRSNASGRLVGSRLRVYDFSDSSPSSEGDLNEDGPIPRLAGLFELPDGDNGYASNEAYCRSYLTNRRVWNHSIPDFSKDSGPNPPSLPSFSTAPKPFWSKDGDRVCTFTIHLNHPQVFYTIITFASTLLAATKGDGPKTYTWDMWGASGAACIWGSSPKVFWSMYGYRLATVSRYGADWSVEVLDFNPDRVRRQSRPDSWPRLRLATSGSPPDICKGPQHLGSYDDDAEDGEIPYPFGKWPIKAELPFLRTTMTGLELNDFQVTIEIDAERLVLHQQYPAKTVWLRPVFEMVQSWRMNVAHTSQNSSTPMVRRQFLL